MSITREFKLPLFAGRSVPLLINANQYDSGETWLFTLLDENGQKYTPASGAIIGLKSDGHVIANAGTVNSSGQVVITENEQMTASPGKNIYEVLIDSDTHGTANFTLFVERRPGDQEEPSDSDLSMFQEAIDAAATIGDVTDLVDDVAVLTARMDSFARLPDGSLSTAADAELADIRVGADGTTYSTAGDAVRGQYSDLKNAFTAVPSLNARDAIEIEANTDLNELKEYGCYRIADNTIAVSLLNTPTGFADAGRLFVMRAQTPYRSLQFLIGANKTPRVWIRYWHGSAWWDWQEIAYISDLPKVSDGDLLKCGWIVGRISNGYLDEVTSSSSNKRIVSDYIFVGQNTKINVIESGYNFNVSLYDLDKVYKGTIPASGWASLATTATITDDCYIRIMARKSTDPVLTEDDIPTIVSKLKMDYYNPTVRNYQLSLDSVPSYYNEQLDEAIDAIRSNMNACGQNGDTFVFITDLHYDPIVKYKNRNARRSPALVKKIIEETGLKKIFFGGDYFTGNDDAMFEFEQIRNLFNAFNIKNTLSFPIIGNHDFNGYNTATGQWDKNTAYAQIIKQCEGYVNMGNDLCYYYDNEACKTRYIFLNTKDTHNRWSGTDSTDWTAQLSWMNSILDDTPSGYNIVIAMHIYYDVGAASTDYALSISQQGSDVAAACDTFNSQNNDKKVKVIITGHAHRDYNSTTTGGIPVVMTDCDSSVQVLSGRDATRGTVGENCFDVITLDYVNNKIKTVRIGRGGAEANRSISLYE